MKVANYIVVRTDLVGNPLNDRKIVYSSIDNLLMEVGQNYFVTDDDFTGFCKILEKEVYEV